MSGLMLSLGALAALLVLCVYALVGAGWALGVLLEPLSPFRR